MAVLLCRSDGKPLLQPVPLEMRGMPRIELDYEPIPGHLGYLGKQVVKRTESQFACVEEPVEVTRKNRHDRHHTQLTQCGFHAPVSHPYKDLGYVELDDRKLILETLGQVVEDRPDEDDNATSQMPTKGIKTKLSSLISPYKVKLHSKTLCQSSELLSMEDKIKHGEIQLGYLRKGRSLLGLMEKEKQEKKLQESRKRRQGQRALKRQWKEAEVATDLVGNGFPETDLTGNGNGIPATDLAGSRNGTLATEQAGNRNGILLRPDTDQAPNKRKSSLAACQMGDLSGHEQTSGSQEEGSVVRQWYRKLSVMVWVLKSMKLENLHYSIPMSHCWDLNCPYTNDESGRRAYIQSKNRLQEWQIKIFSPTHHKSFRTKVKTMLAFSKLTPTKSLMALGKATPTKVAAKVSNETDLSSHRSLGISQEEEDELKRQERFKKRIHAKWGSCAPPVTIDLQAMKTKFSDADQERRMVVHEQLLVMERDRVEALQQRLGSLHVSPNMWRDLAAMREGLQIETTAMARRKLLMNYKWFEDLVALLPDEVLNDVYCQQRLLSLEELAEHMYSVGPGKMSKKKLIQVLATLTSWELQDPDIEAAIMHLIRKVVYVSEVDYKEWLQQHIAVQGCSRPRKELPRPPHQRSPSRIGDTPSRTGEFPQAPTSVD